MSTLEQKAMSIRNSRPALLARFKETLSCLCPEDRRAFKGARLDFDAARLVSVDGRLILQWRLRNNPDMPVSYRNQQTSRGSVMLFEAIVQ